jgi:hypothetical protein
MWAAITIVIILIGLASKFLLRVWVSKKLFFELTLKYIFG